MEIKYIVPSYKRAKDIRTLDYITRAKAVVAESEYEDYRRYHPNLGEDRFIVCPDEYQGHGKGKACNWILDNLWEGCDAIVQLDDDIYSYMAHTRGKDETVEGSNSLGRPLSEGEVYELFENICRLAYEWGCGIWGLSISHDPLVYLEYKPFSTHAYLDGGTIGYVRNDGLRYDEALTLKEDVDFFLQQLQKYHKALRVEKYWIKKDSFTNPGGGACFRTSDEEKRQFREMQLKWGSNIIRPNAPTAKKSSKIRGLGGAIKLNIPLKGV